MTVQDYERLCMLETTPEALEITRAYLTTNFRKFLRKQEQILICYPDDGPDSYGGILAQVSRECDCNPVFWGPDYRWKALLRQAFSMHAITVFGPPLVVLGLMKMARATGTPLYIHDVILSGYPYANWMVEGIKKGLDCRIWGCYTIGDFPLVAGFTCGREAGIHIRNDIFDAKIVDDAGNPVADSQRGHLIMEYKKEPSIIYDTLETARLWHQPCSCGCDDPRVVETVYAGNDLMKTVLEERFLAWSSILDFRVRQSECGLELELVVFPGESLPKIPNCAKLTVRPWNPEVDMPFCMESLQKIPEKALENH